MNVSLPCLTNEAAVTDSLLSEVKQWFARAAQSEIALIYHADPDGVVSAALVSAYFARRFDKPLGARYRVGTHEFDFQKLSRWISQTNPKYVAFFDVNIVENNGLLSEWGQRGIDVLIYDDHDVGPVEPPENVTYLSPSGLNTSRPIPPSLFATLLEGSLQPQHIAAASIGIIGEHLADEYADLLASSPLSREYMDELVRMIVAFYLSTEHDVDDLSLSIVEDILKEPVQELQNIRQSVVASTLLQIEATVDADIARNLENSERWTNKKGGFEFLLKEVVARTRVVGPVASNLRDMSSSSISSGLIPRSLLRYSE
jgi:hypothetical protein